MIRARCDVQHRAIHHVDGTRVVAVVQGARAAEFHHAAADERGSGVSVRAGQEQRAIAGFRERGGRVVLNRGGNRQLVRAAIHTHHEFAIRCRLQPATADARTRTAAGEQAIRGEHIGAAPERELACAELQRVHRGSRLRGDVTADGHVLRDVIKAQRGRARDGRRSIRIRAAVDERAHKAERVIRRVVTAAEEDTFVQERRRRCGGACGELRDGNLVGRSIHASRGDEVHRCTGRARAHRGKGERCVAAVVRGLHGGAAVEEREASHALQRTRCLVHVERAAAGQKQRGARDAIQAAGRAIADVQRAARHRHIRRAGRARDGERAAIHRGRAGVGVRARERPVATAGLRHARSAGIVCDGRGDDIRARVRAGECERRRA